MHGPQNDESAKAQYRVGVGGQFFSGEVDVGNHGYTRYLPL